MRVKEFVASTHQRVASLPGDRTVADAIELMQTAEAPALIVTANQQPIGIFTRSDVMRAMVDSAGKSFGNIALKTVMSADFVTVAPEDEVAGAIDKMLQAQIRYLPVFKNDRIVTILPIEDLVSKHIEELKDELEHLNDYIDQLQDSYKD